MLLVQYPKCSTCQKAVRALEARGIAYTSRDIKAEPPTVEELKVWIPRSGLPVRRFFNTSGMKYRERGLKDKLDAMSDTEKMELLASDGMLVKRPLLIAEDAVYVGFDPQVYEAL